VPETFAAELCGIYNQEFELGRVFAGAGATVIGRVLDEPRYLVTWEGETLVDCAVQAITTGRRIVRPARRRRPAPPRTGGALDVDAHAALLAVLGSFTGCSREYLF